MRIVIIGNYPKDEQESMRLFASLLHRGFQTAGYETELWLPKVVFGAFFKNTNTGIAKWLGYLDKWIIYPIILRLKSLNGKYRGPDIRFHIGDHSNSAYLNHLPIEKTAITCHDVLAIRGALGHKDAYCDSSRMGVFFQKWILRNLLKARTLATVSMFTMRQLKELDDKKGYRHKKDWRVILNSFNQDFYHVQAEKGNENLRALGIKPEIPFILNVGSNEARKNRKLVVKMLAELGDRWDGKICMAGKSMDEQLKAIIREHGLQERIISVIQPKHEDLVALYSACSAFVFPSYAEGFGWPIIEAQACGTVVITSDIEPMPEVSGEAALHVDPDNAKGFAEAFLFLSDKTKREELVQRGYENIKRFTPEIMINAYVKLHNLPEQK